MLTTWYRKGRKHLCWAHAQEELDAVIDLLNLLSGSQGEESEGQDLAREHGKDNQIRERT